MKCSGAIHDARCRDGTSSPPRSCPMPSVYGDVWLSPPDVVAPFMTPVAVTAQAVRRIPRGAQRLWRCAVAAAARRGAIHDARCRDGTSSPPHSARRPALWRCAVVAAGRSGAIHDARCRDGTSSPPRSARRPTLWQCAVAAAARRGAIHDAHCRDSTSSPPHSARRPALWRCAVAAAARRGAIHDARCRDGTSSPPHSARYGLADGGGIG